VTEVLAVDLNGDGRQDVVVQPTDVSLPAQVVSAPPVFLLNQGGGRFVDATKQLFGGPAPAIEWGRELMTADFNGDGRPDIFIADHGHANDPDHSSPLNFHGGQEHLILSSAGGHYVDTTGNLPQQRTFTHSAAVADVNGDGAPDIFENNLTCCSDNRIPPQILLNDGTGHFSIEPDAIRGEITDQFGHASSYSCAFVDVNGDHSPDLVIGGSENQPASQVLLNDGSGHFNFFETLPPMLGPSGNVFVLDMKSADVNGDGSPDLIFAETLNDPWYQTSKIQILINDGHGHFTDETSTRMPDEPQTSYNPWRVLVDDVNDDGRPDLTVHFTGNGDANAPIGVYLNEDGIFRPIQAPRVGYSRGYGGIAWVNGDGPHALFSVEFQTLDGSRGSGYFVTPQILTPPSPGHLRATFARGGVRVAWTPVARAARYQLRRNGMLIATTTSTTFLDRHPTGHVSYTVRSVDAAGTSADSAPAHPT
jgi:hypothetical protein